MNSRGTSGPDPVPEILLAEDNPGDVRLTEEAFREASLRSHLNVVPCGVQTMDFLRRRGPYVAAPVPDLILLDLNLPRKDGREVLAEIKSDPNLRRIPVLVLTTSEAEQDVAIAYDLHANCYIVKPTDFDGFVQTVGAIEEFWLRLATLPPSPASRS